MPMSPRNPTSRPLRIYLIDALPIARLGLHSFFDTQPSVSVVGEASSLSAALPALQSRKPDVLITDTFPIPQAVLRREHKFHVLYTFDTLEHCPLARLIQELRHGHGGFALKSLPLDTFLKAVKQLSVGLRYRDPAFMHLVKAEQRARIRQKLTPSPQTPRLQAAPSQGRKKAKKHRTKREPYGR